MLDFSQHLFTAEQSRRADLAAQASGLSGAVLMERAGRAAYAMLRARNPQARAIGVLCGPGNNGGDGYVLAELAHRDGLDVRVAAVGAAPRPGSEAAGARARCAAPVGTDVAAVCTAPVLVDALLGTGLTRAPGGPMHDAIAALNGSGASVLALDLPSGVLADTGAAPGIAVRADATLSFVLPKAGLYTSSGRALAGELACDDLGIPASARVAAGEPPAALLDLAALRRRYLPPRAGDAHKGDGGHVLVVGGDHGYGGAVRLAGEAALRAGAGLVSVATRAVHVPALLAARPELMVHGIARAAQLRALLARASVVVIGPGLGRGPWGRALLGEVLGTRVPLVMDADALNLLAGRALRRDDWVLTPHPGEAARLLGSDAAQVGADRFGAVRALAARHGGVAVLKGLGTLVSDGHGPVAVCPHGGPALASGGTGDVLAGLIGGLIAQGIAVLPAAALGVCVHGAAADRLAARHGERGLLASALCAGLPEVVNGRDDAGV